MGEEREFRIIRGGAVLEPGASRPRLADILIHAGRIAEIGAPGMPAPAEAETVPAAERLIVPGLVNAHTHSHYTLARGVAGAWTLEMLLNAGPWATGTLAREDLHLGALLGAAEMVRKGCTACYDMVLELPAPSPEGIGSIASAYAEIGMRAVVAPAVADRTFWSSIPGLVEALPEPARASVERIRATPADVALEGAERVFREWPFDRDRIRPAIAPSIPLLCSDDFLVSAWRLAEAHDALFHTHLAESKPQAVVALGRYGVSLTRHLDRLGILGPRLGAAHAIWLDGEDLRILAGAGAAVAHNPGSNLRLGNGIAPVAAMREAGIPVGIGTDAAGCSDHLNVFEALRLAALVSRAESPDPAHWLGAKDVLEMATEGGARVLSLDHLGRIAPRFAADLVLLDLRDVNYLPLNDAPNQVVFCENGAAVAEVMVAGRTLYRDGRFLTIDYDRLVERVRAAAERLAEARATRRGEFDAIEPVVGAFCVGLAREPHTVHRYVAGLQPVGKGG